MDFHALTPPLPEKTNAELFLCCSAGARYEAHRSRRDRTFTEEIFESFELPQSTAQ
jgi:hypothetical protein